MSEAPASTTQAEVRVATPLGPMRLWADGDALAGAHFESGAEGAEPAAQPEAPSAPALQHAQAWLVAYFARRPLPPMPVLAPEGTAFQQRVWQALAEIPYGQTLSYAALTQRLGDMKAIRAVAAANGANPLAIFIPCHRVIGSDGSLTGYAGGLDRKAWLLRHEGVLPAELFEAPLSRA